MRNASNSSSRRLSLPANTHPGSVAFQQRARERAAAGLLHDRNRARGSAHDPHRERVDVDHVEALQRAWIHRAHQALPHLRERPQERGEEHSLAVGCFACEPPGAVKRDDRLPGPRAPSNAGWAVEVGPDDRTLGRVQVHHPLLNRAVEQPADLPLALSKPRAPSHSRVRLRVLPTPPRRPRHLRSLARLHRGTRRGGGRAVPTGP